MASRNRFQGVSCAACLVSAIALVACGGASDDPSRLGRDQAVAPNPPPGPTTVPTATPTPTPTPIAGAVTLEQFLASKLPPSDAAVLGAAQRQQMMELSAQRTVDVLFRAMSTTPFASSAPAGAVPALIAGRVDFLRQAAAGDTLTQISSVRLKSEQIQLVSDGLWVNSGSIRLQGA